MLLDTIDDTRSTLATYQAYQSNLQSNTQMAQSINSLKGSIEAIRGQVAISREARKELAPDAGMSEEQREQIIHLMSVVKENLEQQMEIKEECKAIQKFVNAFRDGENKKWCAAVTEKARAQMNLLNLLGAFHDESSGAAMIAASLKTFMGTMPGTAAQVNQYGLMLKRAMEISNQVSGNETIRTFLQKVRDGHATVGDLTDEVMGWIQEHHMAGRIRLTI